MVRGTTKAALALATAGTVTALVGMAAGPALAKTYPPPSIHLLCTVAPVNSA